MSHRSVALAAVSVLTAIAGLAACGSSSSGGSSDAASSASGGAAGAAGAGAGGASATTTLSYHRDVRPLLEEKCGACHSPGGIGPFTLQSYGDAFAHRAEIAGAVAARLMPPWPPNAACNTYRHDRSLSDAQIAAITGWTQAGAPEGDPKDYVAPASAPQGMSRVDRTLSAVEPYTPTIAPDEYRCFVIDWPETTTKYATGFGVKPGNAAIVHHAIAFLATPDILPNIEKLDADDPGPGYKCFGGIGDNKAGWIGGWAPGGLGDDFPAGTGIKIPAGSKVVLQIHYNTANAAPGPDQTQVLLKLDDQVEKEAAVLKFTNFSWVVQKTMNIKANDPDSLQSYSVDASPFYGLTTGGVIANNQPITIYSAALHMHNRGTHGRLEITRGDGTKDCALQIDDWSFHWQGSYGLDKPLVVNKGDKLGIECHFDNTAAKQPLVNGVPMAVQDVNWGERTEDEMCLGLFYATQLRAAESTGKERRLNRQDANERQGVALSLGGPWRLGG
jgi:hypothetical protein